MRFYLARPHPPSLASRKGCASEAILLTNSKTSRRMQRLLSNALPIISKGVAGCAVWSMAGARNWNIEAGTYLPAPTTCTSSIHRASATVPRSKSLAPSILLRLLLEDDYSWRTITPGVLRTPGALSFKIFVRPKRRSPTSGRPRRATAQPDMRCLPQFGPVNFAKARCSTAATAAPDGASLQRAVPI